MMAFCENRCLIVALMIGFSCNVVAQDNNDFSDLASKHTVAESLAAKIKTNDPCVVLSAQEAAAALGAALATPPFRAIAHGAQGQGRPDADGDACRYMSADFRHIDVQLMREGGAAWLMHFGIVKAKADTHAKGLLNLVDGSSMSGEWDEARVVGCCELLVLVGDSTLSIDVTATRLSMMQAGKLADAALRRLDHPLAFDGRAGLASAQALEAKRPPSREPCASIAREDVEAVFGKLSREPQKFADRCQYSYVAANGHAAEIAVRVTWRDGYWEYRQQNETFGKLIEGVSLGEDANTAQAMRNGLDTQNQTGGAWDQAIATFALFDAVKNDVLVEVGSPQTHGIDKVRALVTRTMARW